MIKSAM